MEKEQIESENLCSVCNSEPVWLEGLCQFCYEEGVEAEFIQTPKEVMPKHSRSLKANPNLQRERALKRSVKLKRRK